jgi:hypothetical protein
MTHEINSKDKAPDVSQGHDKTLQPGEIQAILDRDVDEADKSAAKHYQLVSAVGAEGVDKAISGGSITGIDIFTE